MNSHELAETNVPTDAIVFDFETEDANIERPVIRNGTYAATVKSTVSGLTAKGAKKMTVGFALTEKTLSTEGKEVNPGFTVYHDIIIEPVGKLTMDLIKENVAKLNFAATGKKTITSTADLIGKPVRLQMKVREEQKVDQDDGTVKIYGAKHEVSGIYPMPKTA